MLCFTQMRGQRTRIAILLVSLFAASSSAQSTSTRNDSWQAAWNRFWNGAAGERTHDDGPEHERVRGITARERELAQGTTTAVDAAEHHLRSSSTALSDADSPARANANSGADTSGFRPDRQTELNADVGYHENFDPAISPWKRLVALERIALDDDGVPVILRPERQILEPVAMSSGAGVGSEVFLGRVTLDFSENHTVALPSVAPHAELFSVRASTDVQIQIVKDQSDNFFAVYTPRFAAGTDVAPVVLTFGMAAPSDYFGGTLPDTRVNALQNQVLPLPSPVVRDGLLFAAELGLSRSSSFREAIEVLTEHFRSFQESHEPPPDTGNIFLDLARGKRGICRHRAYAFVLTAASLGIHARFVHNEAHAWVEVQVPVAANYPRRVRWLRVDLGGAAARPHVTGLNEMHSVHHPENADALPAPNNYTETRNSMLPASGNPSRGAAQNPASTNAGTAAVDANAPVSWDRTAAPSNASENGNATATATDVTPNHTATTNVRASIDTFPGQAQRGLEIEVQGQVEHPGTCAVWVFAENAGTPVRLGQAISHEGFFSLRAGVPSSLAVGRYRIVAQVVRCEAPTAGSAPE